MSKWLCPCFRKKAVIDYWDCSHLKLTDIPREVYKHRTALRALYLNSNNIKDVPKGVFLFESLVELDLSENNIIFLSPSVSQLSLLTSLNLSKNTLSGIPDAIQHCQELVHLDISSNPLNSLCEGLTELRQLRTLMLNDCSLEELPPNIGKLSKLEILELRENLLMNLPSSLSHMTLLEKLDLGVNEFQAVSGVIGSLESLSELWLDGNALAVLPDEIGNLHNLKFLELSENQLLFLPLTISGLISLTDLYLQDNLLSLLPETIGKLLHLVILRLDSNRLSCLPDTIDGWTSVSELSIAHNHLAELSPSIGGLSSLTNLCLDANLLADLPEEIGGCTSLKVLSLRNNQLMELPSEIEHLTQLSIVNLIGNRLHHLPYSLTALKNLTALWVAENQNRPIVDFQMQRDEGGEKWLTCYLFPQQGHEMPYEESLRSRSGSPSESGEGGKPPLVKKRSSVIFDPKVEDKKSKISRDLTPYPKELHAKAMHWRASRDAALGKKTEGENGEVQLRSSPRRLTHRPYSFLKALSDPLDEVNLVPSSQHKDRSTSPDVSPIKEGQEYETSTSPEGGEIERTNLVRHDRQRLVMTSPTSPPISSPPPLQSPVSYATSPGNSRVGSFIEPPAEFSANAPIKIRQNGVLFQAAVSDQDMDASLISTDNDQAALLAHGVHLNGNSNNNNAHFVASGRMRGHVIDETTTSRPLYAAPVYPSEISTLSHSDMPNPQYSSMESGFIADNEMDTSAWYLSPDSSPKQSNHRKNPPTPSAPSTSTEPEIRPRIPSAGSDYDHLVEGTKRRILTTQVQYSVSVPKTTPPRFSSGHSNSRSLDAADVIGTAATSLPPFSPISPPPMFSKVQFEPSHHKPQPKSHTMAKKNNHTRSFSQPEELDQLVLQTHRGNVSSRPPNSSQHQQHAGKHHTQHQLERDFRGPFFNRKPEHVKSEETVLQSNYPGLSRDRRNSGGSGRCHYVNIETPPRDLHHHVRSHHHSDSYHRYHGSDGSQSPSGMGTPGNTSAKFVWMSGHDSGFDSMKRSSHPVHIRSGSGSSPLSHSGTLIEVGLLKDPNLGLGITGGRGGENAVKPGDTGFHVYRIVEGSPAHKSGRISLGDKLLEVDGIEVAGLTSQEVLALLTGPEKQVSLVLYREPSVTLL